MFSLNDRCTECNINSVSDRFRQGIMVDMPDRTNNIEMLKQMKCALKFNNKYILYLIRQIILLIFVVGYEIFLYTVM